MDNNQDRRAVPDDQRQLRRSVLRNLLVWMISFGIFIGILFPPFARIALGTDRALSLMFFAMCIFAGYIVGLANFLIFRVVVLRELDRIVVGMQHVLEGVASIESFRQGISDGWTLNVTSVDAIGNITHSFNDMTEAIARRLTLEEIVRSLNSALSSSVELEDVSINILNAMIEVCAVKAGLLYADTGDTYELLANYGIDQTDKVPDQIDGTFGPLARALETGRTLPLSPLHDGLEWISQSTPLGQFIPRNVMTVPLMEKHRAVGLVILACDVDRLTTEQEEILEAIRTQASPYLQNAVLHRKITDLAAIDDLTRILNRRFGLRRLNEEFSRSVRHGVPISILMTDIDHFKSFNDTYGHDAGDKVLVTIASTIEQNLRAGDVLCRYGGEEFMITATGTGLHDGAKLAERLRRILETTRVLWGPQDLSVSVSIGLATWPMTRVSTSEELVTAADKALYAAKEWGRNQVVAHRGDKMLPASSLENETGKPSEEK